MLNLSHRRRKLQLFIVSLAISITTLLFILFFTPYKITPETIDALAKINPFYLSVAIGMHIAAWIIWSFRLKLMSDFVSARAEIKKRKHLKLSKALKIILSSYFAASITPSQFGGEPVRIYLLSKNGLTVGDSTVVVFGERALDLVVVIVGAAISFMLFRALLSENIILYAIFTFIGACLCVGVAIMAYGIAKPEKAKKIIDLLLSKILRYRRLEKLKDRAYQELDNFYNALKKFQNEGKNTLRLALIFTLAFWLAEFLVPSFILLGFGANPVWIPSIAAQFILTIVVAIPTTPGSSGVAELSLAYLYSTLVAAPLLGVFVVTWRLTMYYMNLIVGSVISVKILGESRTQPKTL